MLINVIWNDLFRISVGYSSLEISLNGKIFNFIKITYEKNPMGSLVKKIAGFWEWLSREIVLNLLMTKEVRSFQILIIIFMEMFYLLVEKFSYNRNFLTDNLEHIYHSRFTVERNETLPLLSFDAIVIHLKETHCRNISKLLRIHTRSWKIPAESNSCQKNWVFSIWTVNLSSQSSIESISSTFYYESREKLKWFGVAELES